MKSNQHAAGSLYICGGYDGAEDLMATECFNSVAGSLYIFGGYDGAEDLTAAECFNSVAGAWEPLPPMSEHRSRAATAAVTCDDWQGSADTALPP